MANTYTLIASNTLSSSAASVTFSAIPNTYTDLVLRFSARRNDVSNYAGTVLTFNSSSASNYSETLLYGFTTTVGSLRSTSATYIERNYVTDGGATSNTFANGEIYIPSYSASVNKPLSGFSVTENNSATAIVAADAALWRDSSAITSITIGNLSTTQFVSGSSFFLYGIKNS